MLWRFLTPILPNERHRGWACWLVALSGGFEFIALGLGALLRDRGLLSPAVVDTMQQDLSHLQGWNSFQSFHNPLWIVGLT